MIENFSTFMKAAVVLGDRPEFQIVRIPTPLPKTGEALVKVVGCGVCHTDLHVLKSEVSFPRPAALGHEISGTIVAFGDSDVSLRPGLELGDAVVGGFIMPCTHCPQCLTGRDDLCSEFFQKNRLRGTLYDGESRLSMPDGSFLAMYSMGGLAEYAVVPLSALAKIPSSLDLAEAAILGCAGMTAFGAVNRVAQISPGSTVTIVGVGGVGSSLIPVALAAGAGTVIAVDVVDEKLQWARLLGANHVVNARTEDPVTAVRALTNGGSEFVFEALGHPETFRQSLEMLADGGTMVAIGIATAGVTAQVEITPLVRRGHRIAGSFGARTREDLPQVVSLASDGAFPLSQLVTRKFSLEQVNEAYQSLAMSEIIGRAIIQL
jgi:S-(hydroxymethyl)glutathione dehydrogenase/alcohol dehydrogenase